MFWHIFSYRFKCILRDKLLIFWTLAFPVILATFFNAAFSNLHSGEVFKSINIAVVNNDAYKKDNFFKSFLGELSQGDERLFNLTPVTEEEAEEMLNGGKVVGYIIVDTGINLIVKNSGINQTIVKSVLDEYNQIVSSVSSIVADNPEAIQKGLLEDIRNRYEYTKNIQLGTKAKPDSSVNYFYTVIAMACLYGSFFGLKEVTDTQADLSKRGARLNVAPVHKLKALTAGLCAGCMMLFLEMLILISYLIFVLKIDFGNQIGYALLACFAGCTTGISFGAVISAIIKKGEGVKVGVLIGASMTATFLSGMMYESMKYIVAKNVPILSYINPAALITDAFYALYYYDTHTRYFTNIGLLGGFTVLFCLSTYLITRRQKYANI